jgi:hypothetical protein
MKRPPTEAALLAQLLKDEVAVFDILGLHAQEDFQQFAASIVSCPSRSSSASPASCFRNKTLTISDVPLRFL